jgi:hypothetical protein
VASRGDAICAIRLDEVPMIDWSRCPDAERIPGKVSGAWLVKGTRLTIQAVLDNAEDYTPEVIGTELYPALGVERARRIIKFARQHAPHPA